MKNQILTFIFLFSLTFLQGQNLSDDFTANDFITRNATKLISVSTSIDTVTQKTKTSTEVEAIYNPKTKIITIQPDSKHKFYRMTDSLNELYVVNKHGIRDTISDPVCVPKYSENKLIMEHCGIFYFYNNQHQIIRIMVDTTGRNIMGGWENLFFYKDGVLVKRIDKNYDFYAQDKTLYYEVDKPRTIIETTYENNIETSFRSQIIYPQNVSYTKEKSVTEKTSHTIFTRNYCNDKLTGTFLRKFE